MDNTAYFIEREVYDELKRMVNESKSELNPELLKNPKFDETVLREIIYVYQKTMNKDFKISVSPDKNSLVIMNFTPVTCGLAGIAPKRTFFNLKFSLKDGKFVYEVNQGTLFDTNDLRKHDMDIDEVFRSKIETMYLTKYFDEEGIEYSFSTYNDCFFFPDSCDEIDLREKVMSSFHKPGFSEFKLAVLPKYILRAKIENIYRKLDTLSIIHSNTCIATEKGYKDLRCSLFLSSPIFPDKLIGAQMVAKTNDDELRNGMKLNILDNYGATINDVYDKAKNYFKTGLETSPLKEKKNNIYNAIMRKVM